MLQKVDSFLTRIAREPLAPVYLIAGDEPLQVQWCQDALRQSCRRQGVVERTVFDSGGDFSWTVVAGELCSPSLFAERRLIEVRLHDQALGKEGAKVLNDFCKLPDAPDVLSVTLKKFDRKAQETAWFRTVEKRGLVVQVWPVKAAALPRWLQQRARQKKLTLTAAGAELLAEQTEGNLLAAEQELDRLALLEPDGCLDAMDLIGGLSSNARYDVFMLVDAALAGDVKRVVTVMNGLREEGVEPVLVNWALTRELRQLCLTAHAGTTVPTGQGVHPQHRALVEIAMQRHSAASLQELLLAANAIDRCIKGIRRDDPWLELSKVLVALAGPSRYVPGTA